MAFTDYFVPIRRMSQHHEQPIRVFGCTLGLLIAGELCLRSVLAATQPRTLLAIQSALLQPLGLLGLALLAAALLFWTLLLTRHQLSFFYPLWGISTLLLALLYWITLGGWMDPSAGFGGVLVLVGAAVLVRGGHDI